jgi:hypothetical protein
MKKTSIFIILLLIGSSFFAQNWDTPEYAKGKKYEGYIILNNGDTLHGLLTAQYPADLNSENHVSIMLSNQTSCLFYNEQDKTTTRYKAKELKEYMLTGRHYVSMEYNGGLAGKSKSFVLKAKEGKIAEFVYYTCKSDLMTNQNQNESKTDYYNRIYFTKTIYYREGAKPVDNESLALGFKKKMAELVSDNEKLAAKILNKEKGYRMLNIEKIINEYNKGI